MSKLDEALAPVRKRMRVQRAFEWLMVGLMAGAAGVLLLRIASFLWPFPTVTVWSAAVFVSMPLLFVAVAGLWPIPAMDAARQVDALGLRARVQTALMLKNSETPMAEIQREDTLACLSQVEPKERFPLRIHKAVLIVLVACAAAFGFSFLIPNPQLQMLQAKASFRTEMKEVAKLVEQGVTGLDPNEVQTPELRKLMGDLARELRDMSGPKEALTALDETERKMAAMQQKEKSAALAALKSAGLKELAHALETSNAEMAKRVISATSKQNMAAQLNKAAQLSKGVAAAEALSQAARAVQTGNAAQALEMLQNAALGQSNAMLQAAALSAMVRNATVSASMQQAAALQLAGFHSSAIEYSGFGGKNGGGTNGAKPAAVASSGAGIGSSNLDGGYKQAAGAAAVQGNRPASFKTADYESIYDPTRLGGEGETVHERGHLGEGSISEATIGTGLGSTEGNVPYNQVLTQYQETAVEAVQNADLPAYAQKWVEAYFGALAE
ncbi:MAG: hypothetical protein RR431_03445 [Clostridia bacterium]